MGFMEALKNEALESCNESVTENGAIGYRTTGKYLLDINFAVASLRAASVEDVVNRFKAAFLEDKVLALKWLFFARDIRGGLGERRLFRLAMEFVAVYEPEMVLKLIRLVPEYGRFDDLWCLLDDEKIQPDVIAFIKEQLDEDMKNYQEKKASLFWQNGCLQLTHRLLIARSIHALFAEL